MPRTIPDSEITFVVQGPVQASSDRSQIEGITQQCLSSIRQYFPGSTIILSTWQGQVVAGLDYDVLVESPDPGSNFVYNDGKKKQLNNNRQLVSTHQGLRKVNTQYAAKLRTDSVLCGRGFVDLFDQYADTSREEEYAYLKQRIVTSSTYFIGSHYGKPVYFHKSDIFDFGLTEDLLKVWSDTLIPELQFTLKPGSKERYPATEQYLCLSWIGQLMGRELHINNKAGDDAGLGEEFWERFLANNIIVDTPAEIGLDVTERFYKRGNLSLEYDIQDWKALNGMQKPPFDLKRANRLYKHLIGKLNRTLG